MDDIPPILLDYMEGLKTRDVERIAATVAADLAVVTPLKTLDRAQFLALLRGLYAGFPDWHYDHDPPERQGAVLRVKWRQGGTHTGTLVLPGLPPIPATGRPVMIPEHYFFYQVRDGKIVEIRPEPVPGGAPWGVLQQIGAAGIDWTENEPPRIVRE